MGVRINTHYQGSCCEWCDDLSQGRAIGNIPPEGILNGYPCADWMCSEPTMCSGKGYGKLTSSYALTPYPSASTWEQASGHSCQNGGECQCGGQCKGGYSNVEGIPPDPADGIDRSNHPDISPNGQPPSVVDTVKADLVKTDASDEGYVVDPLRKKFEPYIIGGLVAVGVLFLFGMVKVGSERQN